MTDATERSCGIVRPIAAFNGYSAAHWQVIHDIVCDAASTAGFSPRLVSESDEFGVIQGRIVKNLFDNDIVICDVSGKNPNVMFELGMRLAFDKPTIVLKDDITDFSFDTSPLEHLLYPRDFRYNLMVEFRKHLVDRITATADAPKNGAYKSFLQHFGPIRAAALNREELPVQEFLIEELKDLKAGIARLSNSIAQNTLSASLSADEQDDRRLINVDALSESQINKLLAEATRLAGVRSISIVTSEGKKFAQLRFDPHDGITREVAMRDVVALCDEIAKRPAIRIRPRPKPASS